MWDKYRETHSGSERDFPTNIPAWHFCDNELEANECADLVLAGKKRATSPSLWELEISGEKIPEPGDLNIVTDWDGIAQCIIQTTHVEIVPFNRISAAHARLEGEGDGSLHYWKQVHRDYYRRILKGSDYEPSEDMPVICEQFRVVYPEKSVV